MAAIFPFRAVRPAGDKVHLVPSRSHVSYTKKDLQEKLSGNPFTFLQILHPDHNHPERSKPGSLLRMERIKEKYRQFIEKGIFIQEKKAAFYIYTQLKNGISHTGIITCLSVDDYLNGVIKKHEDTLEPREQKLKEYISVVDIHAEPACLFYEPNQDIRNAIESECLKLPLYDFTTTDLCRHTLWAITEQNAIDELIKQFSSIPSLYIADGHHRSSASALYCLDKRNENPSYTGKESFNYFMGILFSEDQLRIYRYNRLVKPDVPVQAEDFLRHLNIYFTITPMTEGFMPEEHKYAGLCIDERWYMLEIKSEFIQHFKEYEITSMNIIDHYVFYPYLHITDLRNDKQVQFTSGNEGIERLMKKLRKTGSQLAFTFCRAEISRIKAYADAGAVMAPKSTWIEPKLRSGLTIFDLQNP